MSLPQEPHSSRVCETHASFSRPGSPAAQARSAATGSSSQKTHCAARSRQILEGVQREIHQTSRHWPISARCLLRSTVLMVRTHHRPWESSGAEFLTRHGRRCSASSTAPCDALHHGVSGAVLRQRGAPSCAGDSGAAASAPDAGTLAAWGARCGRAGACHCRSRPAPVVPRESPGRRCGVRVDGASLLAEPRRRRPVDARRLGQRASAELGQPRGDQRQVLPPLVLGDRRQDVVPQRRGTCPATAAARTAGPGTTGAGAPRRRPTGSRGPAPRRRATGSPAPAAPSSRRARRRAGSAGRRGPGATATPGSAPSAARSAGRGCGPATAR